MNNTVSALAVSGSDLYAGGNFTNAGGVAANRIAKWNGMSWSALGSGMDNRVSALAVSGSNVYAGGWFTNAGGVAANYIAKWNGSVWSALGSGMDGSVYSLAVSGSDVYAGGYFSSAGGSTANSIAKWNGSSWSALGPGVAGYDGSSLSIVGAIALSGSIVYVGGQFTMVDGRTANGIAKWDGNTWSPLGAGMGDAVDALAVSGGDLYVGGRFTSAGGVAANYIAKWDGSAWSALGSGMETPNNPNSPNYPYFTRVYSVVASGSDLYAGGVFTTAGGRVSGLVARGVLPPFIIATNSPFAFRLVGPTGSDAVIQASTDLQTWTPLLTNSLTGGSLNFTDPLATNSTRRFYRALLLP